MAREKATFGNGLTLQQQESADIAEAVEPCKKSPAAEPEKTEIDPSFISAEPL